MYVKAFNRIFANVFQDRKRNVLESENRRRQELKSMHSGWALKESLDAVDLSTT